MQKNLNIKVQNSILRTEGPAKLSGKTKFIDDMRFPVDLLYGATVRSPVARGILKKIVFSNEFDWDDFTIVTAKDIPGKNVVSIIEDDWPFLVSDKINYIGDPIALIAHHDKDLVAEALNHISFKIDELPPVFSIDDSRNKKEIIWRSDNTFKSYLIKKGDVDSIWESADFVIEQTYETGAQEHLYIENNGMIAVWDDKAGITIWGSMQCPYYVHNAIMPLFSLPAQKVRIIQAGIGGAFGGKEDFPSLIAGHCALLAYKAKRPVKLIYNRREDLANTTRRHPSKTTHKTAVNKDGKILGMDIDFALDGGAYATISSVVLSRGAIHAAGPYDVDNIKINANVVATNTPPNGAFRGFGVPQSCFALECHLDFVAKKIGITPEQLRRKNFIASNGSLATGQIIRENIDYQKLMDLTFKHCNFYEKLSEFNKSNRLPGHLKKGIGFSAFMHGGGFTGSGEDYLSSIVGLTVTEDNKIKVLTSSTEMGQGKNTIFTQIVAETLNISPTDVLVPKPDTAIVPNSGPTVASRTTMIVGKLLEDAANSLKDILIGTNFLKQEYSAEEFFKAAKNYSEDFGTLKAYTQYKNPGNIKWDDSTHLGDAYPTYSWAIYVAEVTINTLTYETKVDNFTALQEVGRVVNNTLATGQIQGGVLQAIGYAIFEKIIWEKGQIKNNNLSNYVIPTSLDAPNIDVYFEQWNKEYGPQGAKGIGELPMDGPAPAVINAVNNALNTNVNAIPMLPENLMKYMEKIDE
ncbi:MAG: xanthine dehydrogenase family protein [Bacteriovoracaceae bacterium]|nr:xanthine dehydrogenase family protein [Bacteriovoracaceae bacterium]